MRSLVFILVLCSVSFAFPQNKKIQKQIENQKEDFHVLKTSIFELEAKPNRYVSKDSLEQLLNEIEKQISAEVVSDIDLYRMYASLLAQFQSGHTGILPTKHIYRQWFLNKSSIPIDVVVNGGKLYAYSEYLNVSKEKFNKLPKKEQKKNKIEEDAEIVSIDGLNLESWMAKIAKYVGSDENQSEFRYEIVKGLFEFYRGLTLDSIPKESEIRYLSGRDTLTMYVPVGYAPGEKISERIRYTNKQNKELKKDFGSFKMLNGKYGYLKFPSFINAEGRKYEGFLKETFSKINKKKVDKLVIDLRGNTGGYMQYELMKYFVVSQKELGEYHIVKSEKPTFKKHLVKDDSYRINKKNLRKIAKWEKRTGVKYNGITHANEKDEDDEYYLGKIVVLTDRSTFSAASVLAAQLVKMKGAKVVGVKAGGSFYEGVAGTHKIILPNSKMALLVNPNYYKTPIKGKIPFDQSVKEPDVKYQEVYGDPKKVGKKNEQNLLKALKKAFAL